MALIINGERVEDARIQAEAARIGRSSPPRASDLDPETTRARIEDVAKGNVVAQTVVAQAAREFDCIITDAEIDAAVVEMRAQFGGAEGLSNRAGQDDAEERRLRERVETDLRMRKLLSQVCDSVPEPSEGEMAEYFQTHMADFVQPAEIRASHVVRKPDGPDDTATYEKMVAIRRELMAGADFAELARAESQCRDEPGGDLGFFAKGQMVEGFEAVVFSMDVNEISPVFMTQFGYHVATVVARREPRQRTFEEVKADLTNRMIDEAKDDRFNAYLTKLQSEATIVDVPDQQPGPGTRSSDTRPSSKGKKAKKGGKRRKKTRK